MSCVSYAGRRIRFGEQARKPLGLIAVSQYWEREHSMTRGQSIRHVARRKRTRPKGKATHQNAPREYREMKITEPPSAEAPAPCASPRWTKMAGEAENGEVLKPNSPAEGAGEVT